MNRFFYSTLIRLLLPLAVLRLGWRGLRERAYHQNILERFGFLDRAHAASDLWVHAVSAGESIAAGPLIEQLLDAGFTLTVTTTTPAGRAQLSRQLGTRGSICYAPFDISGAISRFLRRVRPRMVLLVETELWPNWLAEMHRQEIFIAVVNGRLSEKSARGYQKLQPLMRRSLAYVDWMAVQSEAHRARFIDLGALPDRVAVTGSIKADQDLPNDFASVTLDLSAQFKNRRLLLCASTHPGEEAILLSAFQQLRKDHPELVLVLAPRHVPRAEEVCRLARNEGLHVLRQSEGALKSGVEVVVVDRMGALLYWYGISQVAFVGGSLIAHGGHNFLEAALAETAIVTGDSLFNFESQALQFEQAQAMRVVCNEAMLISAIDDLLSDEAKRRLSIERARVVLEENQGALKDVFDVLSAQMRSSLKQ